MRRRSWRGLAPVAALACALPVFALAATSPVAADVPADVWADVRAEVAAPVADPLLVTDELGLRAAWADPTRTRIELGADIYMRNCEHGDPIRESPYPMVVDGNGHYVQQTCFEKRVLRQDGTGWVELRDITLTRGGSDGPGAAVTTRGELAVNDSVIKQNLSEEPGGGLFSMRRVIVNRSHIDGNLANDDGGGVYARRGGVQVYDSVLSNNLVDGSGGAVGSTGDILIVRSEVDGNTTDGDGGALYADEDGDVTVIDSIVDGSAADGPGGGIFTVDGDVAVLNSTLIGNRADDRGGAIAGEDDILLVNSTVARNLAVAHAAGALWSRGDTVLVNSTVTDNYAEGEGGGALAAGHMTVVGSTVSDNVSSVGANLGAAATLTSFGSIIGPATTDRVAGDTRPTRRSCRVYDGASRGFNFLTDGSCQLTHPNDLTGEDPDLMPLEDDPDGFVLTPRAGSPVLGRIPSGSCATTLPVPLPAGVLLDPYVDWADVLARDAVGTLRDQGTPCDIGAVQSRSTTQRSTTTRRAPGVDRSLLPDLGPRTKAADATGVDDLAGRALASTALIPHLTAHLTGTPPSSAAGRLYAVAARLAQLDTVSRRADQLRGCVVELPTDHVGDLGHTFGFRYDERDGTGLDTRPALALHAGRGAPDLALLRLTRSAGCLSAPSDPLGAGADARPVGRPIVPDVPGQLKRLQAQAAAVEARLDRFDEWESCLTWLPVTESGHPEQELGYQRQVGGGPTTYDAAIDLDSTEWDDPDYQLLAFQGPGRPGVGAGCEDRDPGESADRVLPRSSQDDQVAELEEDVEDLTEPVEEITRFDQCLYTVGARDRPDYVYQRPDGVLERRNALSFDLHGEHLPQWDLLAFPGEEPPQIECNEDAASGESDD